MKKQVMTQAWAIAREAAATFGGRVVEFFAQALRQAWAMAKTVVPVMAGAMMVETAKPFVPAELTVMGRNGALTTFVIENATEELLARVQRVDYCSNAHIENGAITAFTNRAALQYKLPDIIRNYNVKNTPKKAAVAPQQTSAARRVLVQVGEYNVGDMMNGCAITGFGKSWRYNGEHSADGFHPSFDGFVCYAYFS